MFSLSTPLVVSSLLALSVGASPLAQAATGPSTDACGPNVQVSGDPTDSCSTAPPTVTSAGSFGVIGSSVGGRFQSYDWGPCTPVIDQICNQMFAPNFATDAVSSAFLTLNNQLDKSEDSRSILQAWS